MNNTVSAEQVLQLQESLKKHDWFFDLQTEPNRFIVYTHWMNAEVLKEVPATWAERQVLLHFAAAKTVRADQYVQEVKNYIPQVIAEYSIPDTESNTTLNVQDLIEELDSLEKICGSNILQDIFFEVHDGKNAVTNLSAKYPEVRASLESLYIDYGFDVIYEELDG